MNKTEESTLQEKTKIGRDTLDKKQVELEAKYGKTVSDFIYKMAGYYAAFKALNGLTSSLTIHRAILFQSILSDVMARITHDLACASFGEGYDVKLIMQYMDIGIHIHEDLHNVIKNASFNSQDVTEVIKETLGPDHAALDLMVAIVGAGIESEDGKSAKQANAKGPATVQ